MGLGVKFINSLSDQELKQCAKDLLELFSSGVLPDGKVKELRDSITKDLDSSSHSLKIAEDLILRECSIRFIKQGIEWVDPKIALPEPKVKLGSVPVIICLEKDDIFPRRTEGAFYSKKGGFHTDEGLNYDNVVYWAYIPKAPSE
jgi:hypothetical protein